MKQFLQHRGYATFRVLTDDGEGDAEPTAANILEGFKWYRYPTVLITGTTCVRNAGVAHRKENSCKTNLYTCFGCLG